MFVRYNENYTQPTYFNVLGKLGANPGFFLWWVLADK